MSPRGTTPADLVGADLVGVVSELDISAGYISGAIDALTSIGSSAVGYRTTGTPEDHAVAAFVLAEMRSFGLADVATEAVAVDAWRFRSASVRVGSLAPMDASSFGGVTPTPDAGVTGPLVDVGDPRRSRLDRLQLRGCIALVEWRSKRLDPALFVLELARRGVQAMIIWCPPGGAWFQGDGALGAFDGHWPAGAPPMVMITQQDALRVRALCGDAPVNAPLKGTVTLRAEVNAATTGCNVVGYLPGAGLPAAPAGPIVIGAHHDAWFRGAFDNTSGVAALLAIARALCAAGTLTRHTLCFTSRTGEEFGRLDAEHDWCVGAWQQVDVVHPEWGEQSPFHLCLEASGHPALRTNIEAPIEYRSWARAACRVAEAQGWTPTGWRVGPPVAGTEQWPFLLKGVPGVAAYAWETSFADSDYHTQRDTSAIVDPALIAAQARLYALLLLDADRRPDEIVDHRPRARQLASVAKRTRSGALAAAADTHRSARGRAAFTAVGRAMHALDAHTAAAYPHEQALRDLRCLDAALVAIDSGDVRSAVRKLREVGSNRLFAYLGKPALQDHLRRLEPAAVAGSWGAASHLTSSPNLWDEINSLTGGTDAKPDDGWVRASLVRARDLAREDLDSRLGAMARSITAHHHPAGTRKATP